MKPGIRTKLFLILVSLVLIVVLSSGLLLAHLLRKNLVSKIETELERHAKATITIIETMPIFEVPRAADQLADRIGEAVASRTTIVLADGTVIGDSQLTPEELKTVENHLDRPEIQSAMRTGYGKSTRMSSTVKVEMLYVAVRFHRPTVEGTVRISRPLHEVDEVIRNYLGILAGVGAVSVLIAVIISAFSSHYISRSLRRLIAYARRVAKGESEERVDVSTSDELGWLARSLNLVSDQLKQQMTEMIAERDRFETVLEGMTEGVIALDENRRVTMINKAGIMLLGLVGQPIGKTMLETIKIPELHELATGLQSGSKATVEFTLPGTGSRKVLARAAARRSGNLVIVMLDVTELRRLENLRRDFVANVSHELRTPVSIMHASAETLLEGAIDDPTVARRFVQTLLKHSKRLSSLISDLLDISKIESGKYELELKAVPVGEALQRIAAEVETHASDQQVTVKVIVDSDSIVRADARALDQILFNLTDNAIKYTPQDGRVELRASVKDGVARIEVADNGPGIDKKHHKRLFERFYRVDPGRSREMGSTGLGLAIVKHLVLAMHGEVGMQSNEPQGSLFWFELPADGTARLKSLPEK